MTGFGSAGAPVAGSSLTVEVRSVNNRYLTVKMKLPPRFLRHEAALEAEVRRVVFRGSVDLFVRHRARGVRDFPVVNERLMLEYADSIRTLAKRADLPGELDLQTVLSLPGVVSLEEADETDPKELKGLFSALRRALKQLSEARLAEGERMKSELLRLLEQAERAIGAIRKQAPKIPSRTQKRLRQRIDRLLEGSKLKLDRTTLEREVALLADRADIAEELARLTSHLEGFQSLLQQKGPVGRSLDFLVQEMAREANTIGSKNQDAAIARSVVELKSQVERLREQVQNLE
ncbi:MAG: YicC/YloC family endoribonuclease [Planctomycetota bacterium]